MVHNDVARRVGALVHRARVVRTHNTAKLCVARIRDSANQPPPGERVAGRPRQNLQRVVAIAVGFLGVLPIPQPGFGNCHPAMLLARASMLSGALYTLGTRHLATRVNPGSLVISLAAVPSVLLIPPLLVVWQTPSSPVVWAGLIFMGAAGGFGHFLVMTAHRFATAATLAPYSYIQLIWTVISGYLVFADVPSIWTVVGAGVVVASGLSCMLARWRPRPVPKGTAGSRLRT